MEKKFEVLTEDTGCRTRELRAYMGKFGAYLNIEVPNPEGRPAGPGTVVNGKYLDPESPQHLVNVNLSINYGLGTGTSRRVALSRLGKARQRLEKTTNINGIYEGEFNEEEPGISDDFGFVEQVYALPFDKSQSGLQRILDQLGRAVDTLEHQTKPSSQLETIFAGRLDEGTLSNLVRDVDAEFDRVTTQTGSDIGVVRFTSNGKRGYGKVSTKQSEIRNEDKALREIQKDCIARVLAPIPIGIVLTEHAGALFTWGTENHQMYSQTDREQYFALFNTLLFQYAKERNLDLVRLVRDPLVRDVFNRAIINTSLENYQGLSERPNILDVEELERRAKVDGSDFKRLRKIAPVYTDATKRIGDLNPGNPVFLHGDARPENIGQESYGIRPLVDWAHARMGSFAADFSTLEARDSQKYLNWYKFVVSIRGKKFIEEDARELIFCHDVLEPYRVATFRLGKERFEEAEKDLQRLERNAQRYKDRFG